jgi:hypothetical protein
LGRQVLCHSGRDVEIRSLATALRRTPQRRRRYVGALAQIWTPGGKASRSEFAV